jgi:hypothetical protein
MTQRTPPKLGESVFVWPALRTARDAHRQPVKNEDGSVKKVPAYVRGSNGARITERQFVAVDLHVLQMILGGNLQWCTREEQRAYLDEQQNAAQPEPVAEPEPRNKKQTTKAI